MFISNVQQKKKKGFFDRTATVAILHFSSLHYTAQTLHKSAHTLRKLAQTLHKSAQTLHKLAHTQRV